MNEQQPATVTQLPEPADRACPECGYRINQLLVDLANANFECPRCGGATLALFVRLEQSR